VLVGGIVLSMLCALGRPSGTQAQASQCLESHAQAQRMRFDGKLIAARAELLSCAQPECPELVASDCTLWLTEVEASLSSVVLAVEGTDGRDLVDVRVLANGQLLVDRTDGRAVPFDPGSYELRFEAQGYAPLTMAVSIRQSEKNRIVRAQLARVSTTIDSHAPEGGHAVPMMTYVLGGVAVASLGAFAYFAVTGKAEHDRLRDTCGGSCTQAQVEEGKRAYVVADIALGVGIASAAAAAIVYFAAGDDDSRAASEPSAGLQAGLSDGGAYLQWISKY
jgi:hypothetical protein